VNERKEKIKTEKTVKAEKEVDREKGRSKRKDRKIKSEKSTRKLRDSSSTEEISEDDEPKIKKKNSSRKNISESESEEDNKERKKRKKEKSSNEKHKVKKKRKLEFATDDSTGEEREIPTKNRKHKDETDSGSASDGDSSRTRESEVATKRRSEKEKQGDGRRFKKWLTLEKFLGTTPLSIFLNQLDTCAKYNGWDVKDKASHLRVSLKGNAAYIIDDENLEGASYHKLIKRFKSRFGTEGQSSLYRSQMRTRKRAKKEPLQTLYHDINRMAGLAYPGKSSIHRELAAIDAFIDALGDSNMRMRVRDKEPKSLDHALHIALLAEANLEAKPVAAPEDSQARTNNYKARVVQNVHKPATNAQAASVESINDRCDKICEMLESMCQDKLPGTAAVQRTDASTTGAAPSTPTSNANITCYKCGNLGHYATSCPKSTSGTKRGSAKGPMGCYSCQGFGHMARNCPKAEMKEEENTTVENVRGVEGPDSRPMKDHPVYLKAWLGKREYAF